MGNPDKSPGPDLPADRSSPPAAPRPSLGRAFDVAAAAAPLADDHHERWLVQKDRLDFGPFSLAELHAHIARGEFRGEHVVVETDSGERRRIADHPLLRDAAREAERRLERQRRARDEQIHERTERKKSVATVLIVGGALALVALAFTIYLATRKSAETLRLSSRATEADVDAFLKNVKVEFAAVSVAPRRPAAGGRRGAARGGGGDPFSMDSNLGDVSQGGGDEVLDASVIQQVMVKSFRSLVPCVREERRHDPGLVNVDLDFVILGSGKVQAVKVNGQRQGALPSCILGKMQGFAFPRFNGAKTVAGWSFRMS